MKNMKLADWKVVRIGDICKVETDSTPSTKNNRYWAGGTIKWITPTDLSKLNGKIVIRDTERKITEQGLKAASLTVMPKGSIIISSRAPIGYIAVLEDEMTFNQGCKGLIIKNQQQVDCIYLVYQLLMQVNKMKLLGTGSTFKEISKSQISNLQISLPPLPEQEKIAEILSTVDEAIEKIDEIIAKSERLKKGLMQELLSGRVRVKIEDGEIGFYKETNFKNTEIGKIPADWEVTNLRGACEKIKPGGTPLTSKTEFYGGNIKFVKIEDLTNSKKYILDTTTAITETGLNNSNAWLVPENSVLIGIYGSLGATAINKVRVATNQAILGIIPDKKRLNEEFLYYFFLNSKNIFLRQAKHTTQANLTLQIIENLKIPLPPLQEQQKIAEILSTVDKRLELLRNKKEKLLKIKKGLMNDLLTGKRRVKI